MSDEELKEEYGFATIPSPRASEVAWTGPTKDAR
jgi:hypothetical protein